MNRICLALTGLTAILALATAGCGGGGGGEDTTSSSGTTSGTTTSSSSGVTSSSSGVTLLGALTVTLDATQVTEGGAAVSGTVTRSGSTASAVSVTLLSSNTSRATVSTPTLNLAAGVASATFTVSAVNDDLVTDPISVIISASGSRYTTGSATITVVSDDVAALSMTMAATSLTEGGTGNMVIRRNASMTTALTVTLGSSDASEATVPATVTIAANQTTATVVVTAVDENDDDGDQTAVLSATSTGFADANLSLTIVDDDPCVKIVSAPTSLAETAGAVAITLRRSGDITAEQVITLSSSDTTEIQVPASVTIPAGAATVDTSLQVVDDDLDDGNQSVTITLSATGYSTVTYAITVTDDDPRLMLTIAPTVISEVGGLATGTVRTTSGVGPMTINLSSSDTTEATVPASVTIPVGLNQVTFTITAVDDTETDGPMTVTIRATSGTLGAGVAQVTVADNEHVLTLSVSPTSMLENGGTATGTVTRSGTTAELAADLVVALSSSDTTEATVPASVTIPAAQYSATFAVTAVDDADDDEDQVVKIQAVATGYDVRKTAITVVDDETPFALRVDKPVISENGGTATITVARPAPFDSAATVTLTCSDATEATVPATVAFAAGSSLATFTITGVDDLIVDGTVLVTVTAVMGGQPNATVDVDVADDDGATQWMTIRGTVADDEELAAGAVVQLYYKERRYGSPVITDDTGVYSFTNLPGQLGHYRVRVE